MTAVFAPTGSVYGRVPAAVIVNPDPVVIPAPDIESVDTPQEVETTQVTAETGAAKEKKVKTTISRKWARAAINVLPEDGSSLSVKEILTKITAGDHLDAAMARVVKPGQSLARDLREYGRVAGSGIVQTGPGQFARG